MKFKRLTVDLDIDTVAIRQRIRNLIDRLLVHLHTVNRQTRTGIQFLVTNVTFEVLGFLVLY